jgi:hypothetical protein
MAGLRLGPLRLGAGGVRRLGASLGAVAVASGLWLGAATAAGQPVAEPGPGAGRPAGALRVVARRPLHQVIASWLRPGGGPLPGGAAVGRARRALSGSYVRPTPDGAVVATGTGREVEVRTTPATRLPARRPRPGEPVLVIGRALPDGTFEARAVFLRRPPAAARALL